MRYLDDVIQDLVVTCRILAYKKPWWNFLGGPVVKTMLLMQEA